MVEKILTQLEKLVYWLQRKYMELRITSELVTPHMAFFHPQDKSGLILTLFKIRMAKAQEKKIVLATGCFDLLHREHLNFLKRAKEEGDVLVIGLEPDERVRKMKGEERPVNPFPVRAENLIRLNEIDYVLRLPDDFGRAVNRRRFLRLIKPQLLAISSQDALEKKKRKECQAIDCQVKIVSPYNPKISTTKIISSWAGRDPGA